MKIFRLFTIAAAALILSACSEDIAQMINGGKKEFSATLAAPNKGGTRTVYTEDTQNNKIAVAWKVGDEIALIHNGVKDVATVKTINADGSATIAGIITKAENEAGVELVYPSALVTSVTSDGNPVFDNDLLGRISTQDGTLKYIQDNLDFRRAKGQLSVNETSATLKEAATMNSMHAIWKLTLQNDAETPAALSAKQVSVQLTADVPILRARTAELTTPISSFYLAMEPFLEASITIEATVGEDTYSYVKEGVTLEAGKYYQSTVTMAPAATDLSKLTGDYIAQDGETLTGTLAGNYKISIADGATVTLKDVTIIGTNVNDDAHKHAGITSGDNSIIILDGTNTVKGFFEDYPGIYVPENKTLTIKGTGSLTASPFDGGRTNDSFGAGIGGGMSMDCGNIEIQGGVITATGSSYAAGIGGAGGSTCGTITISGGTITANGGDYAAGIGSGNKAGCGSITISGGTVTATGGDDGAGIGSGSQAGCGAIEISGGTVDATGGSGAAGIGSGYDGANCGTITISGGTVTATGGENAAGIGSGYDAARCGDITINSGVTSVTATKGSNAPNSIGAGNSGSCGTVTIEAGANVTATGHALSASAVGEIVGSDGKAYAVADKNYMPTGVTKVAMIAYVSGSNGLAIALADESGYMNWATAKSTCEAKTPAFTGGTWKLPSLDEWKNMLTYDAGSYMNNNLQTALSTAGGNSLQEWIYYWSSTDYVNDNTQACDVEFMGGVANFSNEYKTDSSGKGVRAVLAF